jgi:hypothetical protein
MTEIDIVTDEIPRHEPENPYNYTPLELAERKKALRDMERDYPDLPFGWLEMVYDWHAHQNADVVKEIINQKTFECPSKFTLNNVVLAEENKKINKK